MPKTHPTATEQLDAVREILRPLINEIGHHELARRTGISRPAISRWLGGGPLPLDHIGTLAREVGRPLRIDVIEPE